MFRHPTRPLFFSDEKLDLRILTQADSDHVLLKCAKFVLRHAFCSVRLTIVHSRVLRRFLSLTTGSADSGDTLLFFRRLVGNDASVLDVIETENGPMISHIDCSSVRRHLGLITSRWIAKRGRFISSDPEIAVYKKLFRLKFLYDHVGEIYSDKYNIYQAAYVDSAYTLRALLCFVMQIISFTALMGEGSGELTKTSLSGDGRSSVDVVLIVVTILYMFFNLPANSITSSMSHNVILFHVFSKMKMYRPLVFVTMDLVVNSLILSLMPLVSARLLYETANSSSIVTTSLSVFFVTSLDDSAITKSESNNMSDSQNSLLREVTERVDTFVDSKHMWVIAYLPWVEMLLLIASVSASYMVLF